MKKCRVFRTVVITLLLQFLCAVLALIGNAENISLQKPVTEGTSFLEAEAGIAAYTNVGQTIDLTKARSAFRTIENETGEYIVGSVSLPDYEETEDVHAYVHTTGWIVTYYLSSEPVAKIVDWNNYGEDEKIRGTKLESGISILCDASQVAVGEVKYYDFRYPEANKLLIVADARWASEPEEDTFSIKIPSEFLVYERSFSHYCKNCGISYGYFGNIYTSYLYIDDNQINLLRDKTPNYGLLSTMQLSVDDFHTIKISGHGESFGAIVLIYREP